MFYLNEYQDAMDQDAMSQCEYNTAAIAEYASAYGVTDTTSAWVLTPFDSWERNPHYVGLRIPHPEDDDAMFYIDEVGLDVWRAEECQPACASIYPVAIVATYDLPF